jgi:N-acetylglucosaminyldiphosphoundecaprenol N-acetyl-beta-D-mannosaminyltransferase
MEFETANILGVKVNMFNIPGAVTAIDQWVKQRKQNYISVAAVSTIMAGHKSKRVRRVLNRAGLVTPDGMPLVWLGRLFGFKTERVYGPDLMLETCRLAEKKGYSNYFYGGDDGVAELLAEKLKQHFPALKIVGSFSPPFRQLTPQEDQNIIQQINAANPDIIWVGLSSPKQDLWMAEHQGKIKAPVMIGVGAAFNFHSGQVKQAPHWMQRSGLEWIFRLYQEPRRLWKRYLIENPLFVLCILCQLSKIRRYEVI